MPDWHGTTGRDDLVGGDNRVREMKLVEVKDLYVQCAYPVRAPALAVSDCCGKPANSAVENTSGGLYYYRCREHEGLWSRNQQSAVVLRVPVVDSPT